VAKWGAHALSVVLYYAWGVIVIAFVWADPPTDIQCFSGVRASPAVGAPQAEIRR
jgi:hypothetical protein